MALWEFCPPTLRMSDKRNRVTLAASDEDDNFQDGDLPVAISTPVHHGHTELAFVTKEKNRTIKVLLLPCEVESLCDGPINQVLADYSSEGLKFWQDNIDKCELEPFEMNVTGKKKNDKVTIGWEGEAVCVFKQDQQQWAWNTEDGDWLPQGFRIAVELQQPHDNISLKLQQQQQQQQAPATTTAKISNEVPEGFQFHCFLSHNWGRFKGDRSNHNRVKTINTQLQKRGLVTWLDEEQDLSQLQKALALGIEQSCVVLVILTEEYVNKVIGSAADNCKLEFEYFVSKTKKFLLPVVMNAKIKGSFSSLEGIVGLNLCGLEPFDLSVDGIENDDVTMDRLAEEVKIKCAQLQ